MRTFHHGPEMSRSIWYDLQSHTRRRNIDHHPQVVLQTREVEARNGHLASQHWLDKRAPWLLLQWQVSAAHRPLLVNSHMPRLSSSQRSEITLILQANCHMFCPHFIYSKVQFEASRRWANFCKKDYDRSSLNFHPKPVVPIASILTPISNCTNPSISRIPRPGRCNLKQGRLTAKSIQWSLTTSILNTARKLFPPEQTAENCLQNSQSFSKYLDCIS